MTKLFLTQPLPSGTANKEDCPAKVSKDIFTVFQTPKLSVPDTSDPILAKPERKTRTTWLIGLIFAIWLFAMFMIIVYFAPGCIYKNMHTYTLADGDSNFLLEKYIVEPATTEFKRIQNILGLKLVVSKPDEPSNEFVQDNSAPALNGAETEREDRNDEPATAIQTLLQRPDVQHLVIVGKNGGDDEQTVKGVIVINGIDGKMEENGEPDEEKPEFQQKNVDTDAGIPKPTQQTFLQTENAVPPVNVPMPAPIHFQQSIPVIYPTGFATIDPFRQIINRWRMLQMLRHAMIARAIQEMQTRYIQMNAPVMQQLPPLLPQMMIPQYQVPLQSISRYQPLQQIPHPLLYFHQYSTVNPGYSSATLSQQPQQQRHVQPQSQIQLQSQSQLQLQPLPQIQLQPQTQQQKEIQSQLQSQTQPHQVQQQAIQPMQIINNTPKKLDSPHQFPLQIEITRQMPLPQENEMIVDPNLPVEREPSVVTMPLRKTNDTINERDQIFKMLQERAQEIAKAEERQETNEPIDRTIPDVNLGQIKDGDIKGEVLNDDEIKANTKGKQENYQINDDEIKVKAVDPIDAKADEQQTAMVIMEDTFPRRPAEAVFEEDSTSTTKKTNTDDTDAKADEDQTSLVMIEDTLPQESVDGSDESTNGKNDNEKNSTDPLSTFFRFFEQEVVKKSNEPIGKEEVNAGDFESGHVFKQFFEEALGKEMQDGRQTELEEAMKTTVKPFNQVTNFYANLQEGSGMEIEMDIPKIERTYDVKTTSQKLPTVDKTTKNVDGIVAKTPIIPPV